MCYLLLFGAVYIGLQSANIYVALSWPDTKIQACLDFGLLAVDLAMVIICVTLVVKDRV